MKDILITKEQLENFGYKEWIDKTTFVIMIAFTNCSETFLECFSNEITQEDVYNGGYLNCEYWKDENTYHYVLVFDNDMIAVTKKFNNSYYNNIIKELSK